MTDMLSGVPEVVRTWMTAHLAKDVDDQLALYAADVVVVDDGRTYTGRDEVEAWSRRAGSEFTYTTTVLGSGTDGDATVVTARLEGNFPGSPVELSYRFRLVGGLVSGLTISA